MSNRTFNIISFAVIVVLFAIVLVMAGRDADKESAPPVKCECVCPVTP